MLQQLEKYVSAAFYPEDELDLGDIDGLKEIARDVACHMKSAFSAAECQAMSAELLDVVDTWNKEKITQISGWGINWLADAQTQSAFKTIATTIGNELLSGIKPDL